MVNQVVRETRVSWKVAPILGSWPDWTDSSLWPHQWASLYGHYVSLAMDSWRSEGSPGKQKCGMTESLWLPNKTKWTGSIWWVIKVKLWLLRTAAGMGGWRGTSGRAGCLFKFQEEARVKGTVCFSPCQCVSSQLSNKIGEFHGIDRKQASTVTNPPHTNPTHPKIVQVPGRQHCGKWAWQREKAEQPLWWRWMEKDRTGRAFRTEITVCG